MPSISVIVPVYKVEAYLDRCVSSILRQTFRDFELILVDDGSPDNCPALCDGWGEKDSRIHVIHQANGGLSAARNAGIDWVFANSTSSWLSFVDSDDYVHEDFLLMLYKAAAETQCRMVACGFRRTGGEPMEGIASGSCGAMAADDFYCGRSQVSAVAWNKLYHRSLFQDLRYPVGKLHEDEFTTYRMVYAAGEVGVVEDALYGYYTNPQGIMGAPWNPRRLQVLEAFEQQMAFARERGLQRLLRHSVENYVYAIHESLEQVKGNGQRKAYAPLLRRKLRGILPQARTLDLFPLGHSYAWVYEDAYPCKPFWWLYSKVR